MRYRSAHEKSCRSILPRRLGDGYGVRQHRGDAELLHHRRLLDGPSHPAFAAFVEDAGREDARNVLRYLSSELNRLFFQLWNVAQIGIGGAVLWLVWGMPAPAGARLR